MDTTTKRCPRCKQEKHIGVFYPSGTYCKPCLAEYNKQWRLDNLAKSRAGRRRYNAAHPDIVKAARARYNAKMREIKE